MLAGDDPNIRELIASGTDAVAVFGKTWDLHVKLMGNTLEENIAVITSYSIHYTKLYEDKIVEAVKTGVCMAGGTPIEFGVIGVCDGIAMNHTGMKYSLGSRELIADSIEVMATAHAFDALVMVPNCDKIVPGMLMAAARLNIRNNFV